MGQDLIIGQRRVIGLLTFFATPFVLLALPADVLLSLGVGTVHGISLLFVDRFRTVGVGLVAGTVATFGGLLLLAAMLGGVD